MIDLFSEGARRDPYPLYERVRRAGPVVHDPRTGLWLLLGYGEVKRALNDSATFSAVVTPAGALTSEWLIFTDPPRHTRLRSLIMRAFTPRAVAHLERRIGEIAGALLERTHGDEVDLVSEFAMPLPLMVIAEMLGAPADDFGRFRRWSDALMGLSLTVSHDARAGSAIEAAGAAHVEMREYVGRLVDERRSSPEDDLISALCQPAPDGARLSESEILGFFQLLMLAGHETTTNLISNAVLSFIEHSDQLALLRVAPELLVPAIEEVLRFRSPVQAVFRVAGREANIGTTTIPAGSMVLPMLGAANRDVRQFDAADRFDVTRHPNPHIAFGHGTHFCMGASLARLEARIALARLLDRWATFEHATNAAWEPREAFHVLGPSRLPIRFEPSTASAP